MIPHTVSPLAFILAIIVALLTGGVATQLLAAFTGRSAQKLNERAQEVDELAELSKLKTDLMDEVRKENSALEDKLVLVATALINYTNTVDAFMNRVAGIPEEERATLRDAGNAARLVLSRLVA